MRLSRSCWGIKNHSNCNASCSFGIVSGTLSSAVKGLPKRSKRFRFGDFASQSMRCISPFSKENLATRTDARNWISLENVEARTDTKHDTDTNKNSRTSKIVSFYDVSVVSMCSLFSPYVYAFRISSQTKSALIPILLCPFLVSLYSRTGYLYDQTLMVHIVLIVVRIEHICSASYPR